jgi:hypothetical protein
MYRVPFVALVAAVAGRLWQLSCDHNDLTILANLEALDFDAGGQRGLKRACEIGLAEYAGAARQVSLSVRLNC